MEVANWLAAPAATALLADLGADIVKVEPQAGDPFRGFDMSSMGYEYEFEGNDCFEVHNRDKRSGVVALDRPGGPELVRRLAGNCDIFLTNLVRKRCERYGLTVDELHAGNAGLIYASLRGYGARGLDQNRPSFDYAAFWARSQNGPSMT